MTAARPHPFSAFGPAPYRCIGYEELIFQTQPGAAIRRAGACAVCHAPAGYAFRVRCDDGAVFAACPRCISPAGAAAKQAGRLLASLRHDLAAMARKDAIAVLQARLAGDPAYLTNRPHPGGMMAGADKTLRDHALWMLENAGDAEKVKLCRLLGDV